MTGYRGFVLSNAETLRFEDLDFDSMVDFVRRAFDGAAERLYLGGDMNGTPVWIDEKGKTLVNIPREQASAIKGPGIFA